MSISTFFIPASFCIAILLGAAAATAESPSDRYRDARHAMVRDFIEKEGIKNPRVLDAMRSIPRHEFVSGANRQRAYLDAALPIGHKQTISPPFIVAYMTELCDPQPTDRVLEIGTGSGYQAAVLSPIVKEVYSIEIVEPLGRAAGQRLKKLGYRNVTTKVGDGYKGWPEHAPFDKILVTCSPEDVPKPLIEQLKEGGKMIIPLGERYQQMFYLFEKKEGKLEKTRLIPTLFVPMTGVSEENRVVKPDPLNPSIVNGGFEIPADDDSERPLGWHYLRECERKSGGAREGQAFIRFQNDDPGRLSQLLQGLPVDGRKIGKLRVSAAARHEKLLAGPEPQQKAALVIHFYDDTRLPIGDATVLSWSGSSDWLSIGNSISVPPKARELILRVGLNGATGQLDVDQIELSTEKR